MYKIFPTICRVQNSVNRLIHYTIITITHFVLPNLCSQKSQVASSSERGNEPSVFVRENYNFCTLLKTVS